MCGRFTLQVTWADIHEMLNLVRTEDVGRNVPARHNIAPTQDVLYVTEKDGERRLREGRWWLVPHWAKELTSKWPMFNARSEDAHKKPSFRDAYKWGRCLIPADGYFEWTTNEDDGKKDPHFIHLPNCQPFAFAGLSAYNQALDIHSCTILTAAAAPEIEHLHKRMPIILKQDVHAQWLDIEAPVDDARELLGNHRGNELVSYRVGRDVNSSRASGAKLIEPLST